MRNNLILLISLVLSLSANMVCGQERELQFPELSDNAQISLITGEPGKELYTKFGHSAIRVYDGEKGIDLVYNYGTFDFDAPGFYPKFLQGKLNYFLSVYDFKHMVYAYKYYNQSLYEQVLNLTYEEKVAVYNFINENYLPENRFYLYDFFFDNCSSRIRDVFQDILGPDLYFDDSHIKNHKTFRQLLDEFLHTAKWGDFGIDLILGMPTDATASSEQYMFLPYKLFDAFEHASINRKGEMKPFVKVNQIIHQSIKLPGDDQLVISPMIVFSSIFVLILSVSIFFNRYRKLTLIIDAVLFITIGLAGLLIFFLWFATDHVATRDNFNILWASPLHLIIPFIAYQRNFRPWIKYYIMFWIVFLLLFLASWPIFPQQMNIANIPIILALIIRLTFNYKNIQVHVDRRKQ